jgi:hypothetical protein
VKKIISENTDDSLYMQLNMFQKKLLEPNEISDPIIKNVRKNGIVEISFDLNEYFDILQVPEYEKDVLNYLFGHYYNYGGYELRDWYSSKEDWKEGIIIGYFNDENNELLSKLIRIFSPQFTNKSEINAEISKILYDNFDRDCDSIIDEYHSKINEAVEEIIKKEAKEDLCDVFFNYKLYEASCFTRYFTTVPDLIRLYEKYDSKSKNLSGLLKTIVTNDMDFSDLNYSYWYEFNWEKYFDYEGFNSSVERYLENMLEKLEDSEIFIDLDEFKRISEKLKNFEFDVWLSLPKSPTKKFKLKGVDPKTNKIILSYKKSNHTEIKEKKIDYQDFMSFLYNYELFNENLN